MAIQNVTDGKLVENVTSADASKKANSSMDKEAFLKLLVAQMKYQDPMEPTSNTEYIAQYAQFSQVEMLQNMSGTMDSSAALSLVGKYVTVEVEKTDGSTYEVTGKVDYVEKNGKENLLYINGTPYNYNNLVSVMSDDYISDVQTALEDASKKAESTAETKPDKDEDTADADTKPAEEASPVEKETKAAEDKAETKTETKAEEVKPPVEQLVVPESDDKDEDEAPESSESDTVVVD
ncbi:MAG: hypothetical protein IJM23_09425 [Lachnospiraceae bacterium]|nr:hypothetical protein [Lachnospiraceae bacterium]